MKRFLQKAPVFAACLLPLAWQVWAGFANRLGANPISEITNQTGTWTLRFLALTLAITPLRHDATRAAAGRLASAFTRC